MAFLWIASSTRNVIICQCWGCSSFVSGWQASFGVAGLVRGGGPPCPQIWVAADCRHKSAGAETRHPECGSPGGLAPPWPPRPYYQWKSINFANGPARSSFASASCARTKEEQWQSTRESASKNAAGSCAGSERIVINHHPFSLAASPMACERWAILRNLSPSKGL